MKAQLRTKRQATARARRYFRDYELSLKTQLQKKRTNEEQVSETNSGRHRGNGAIFPLLLLQVFRRVFEDGLAILRERERELRRFDGERRDRERERQRQQLQALEQVSRQLWIVM